MLSDARQPRRLTQRQAADVAGISQSAWSLLELGGTSRITIGTWARAAAAVGAELQAYLRNASAADQPRDVVHLRSQELVIRIAAQGGWRALPEQQIDRDARTSRAADVLLHRPERAAREYALIEVWDWFDDVGRAVRDWDRRLAAVERFAIARMAGEDPLPRVSGCWAVRATNRNRRLLAEHGHYFGARFPGLSRAWIRSLARPDAGMPEAPALLWLSVGGDRLYPPRPRRDASRAAPGAGLRSRPSR